MIVVFWAFVITLMMFSFVGVIVCMGVFADRLDDILRGGYEDENGQQDV